MRRAGAPVKIRAVLSFDDFTLRMTTPASQAA
jgi:hypothetical protein